MPGLFGKTGGGGMSEDDPLDDDAFDVDDAELGGEELAPAMGPSEHFKTFARTAIGSDDPEKIDALYECIKAVQDEGGAGALPPLGDEEGLPPL